MSKALIGAAGMLLAMMAVVGSARAQNAAQPQQNATASATFNPRDFTGIWVTDHRGTGGYRSLTAEADIPPRTPWGEARFATTITGRTTDAHPVAVVPALGNDPIMQCNPEGYPRIAFFGRPVEFFQAPGRLMMFFEWQRTLREVWLDGRQLPEDPEPRWLGHAVGRWEGDTLVIDSVGYDDRGWIDMYGNIYSDQMRLQERWRRVGPDTLEVTYRLEDPKAYTRPWISTTKVYRRQTGVEILEEICAPMDELLFNATVRDVAGTGATEIVSETALNQFAQALTEIRRIQGLVGQQLRQVADPQQRVGIIRNSYRDMVEVVRKSGLPLEEYQRIAHLINVEPEIRDKMMMRLAPTPTSASEPASASR